jgi:hypothetical protein
VLCRRRPPPDAPRLNTSPGDLRQRLAITFEHTADVLEQSARLAEDDAARRARQGQTAEHATECERALRARRGAERARANAARLTEPDHDALDVLMPPDPPPAPHDSPTEPA